MENTYVENKSALPVGAKLRQYRIDAVLGAGGFGVTYLASDTDLQAQFAIKEYLPNEFAMREGATVHPKSSVNNDDYRWGLERFLQEARELAKFRHANIVRVHQIFEGNNTAYMILDYEEGVSFGEWLNALGRKPTEDELYGILMALLGALETVHARGLLHRDIAPDNIIMRWDGSPVLLDFGAARQAIGERSKSVSAIVKAGYSPPEQYAVHSSQGEYTDIYALSATFYRAINGEAPPEGTWRQTELMTSDSDPMKPLDRSGYGDSFIEALEAGLLVNAKNRPQTIVAWRQMFEGEAGQRRSSPAAAAQAAGVSGEQPAIGVNKAATVEKKDKKRLSLGKVVSLMLGVYIVYQIGISSDRSEMVATLKVDDWQTITLEQAKQAIAEGYDVNVNTNKGLTPLHAAAHTNENPEVIRALLSAGADVSAKNDKGITPLHAAAHANENSEVTGALLSAGADVNARIYNDGMPLHAAATSNENPEVIRALLSAGADVNATADGLTPLHAAAISNENPEIIGVLLSAGADVSAKNDKGLTPLHAAAQNNENPEVIRALLSAGADVSTKSNGGMTPLHSAANANENPEVIGALLSAGADVNAKHVGGMTPLHMAAYNSENPEIVRALLSAGADVSAKNDQSLTPLHAAAQSNENLEVIGALLSAGADVNAKSDLEYTPLDSAKLGNNQPAINVIRAAGGQCNIRC